MNESKLIGQSLDIVAENVQKLKSLFPEIVTEDKIDFEKLQAVLGKYIDNDNERYNFTWHGKSKALRLAQTPSIGTLRPCKEESKDWDTTQNLYIEGDNLEVLKLLQKTYHNKIKIIFIDPPYNTGNDFVYQDDYEDNLENYLKITGQRGENGGRISTNSEASGRYHTNWLNMMYPRLRLARNLLTDDGAIFITIDDKEVDNLKKVCNEVYGEENFIACVIWQHSIQPKGYLGKFSVHHNYILIYCKSSKFVLGSLERTAEHNKAYSNPDNDSRGLWRPGDVRNALYRPNLIYDIITPSGKVIKPPANGWRWSKETLYEKIKTGEIVFNSDETKIIRKIYLDTVEGRAPETIWFGKEVGTTRDAISTIKELFNNETPFETPKPIGLIKKCLLLSSDTDSIILDFFSGSATTAHAVMQLNAEDGGNRKFIMVQLPEPCGKDTEAYKAGYKNICEIGKERIRRAGEKIKSELMEKQSGQMSLIEENTPIDPEKLDIGFKVFKLDSSNLKKWNPDYDNLETSLEEMISNYVDGRTELDVVYEIMLKYGIDLTLPVEEYDFNSKKLYSIGFGALIICLDDEITKDIAGVIIKLKKELNPETMRVVFKDNGFKDDATKTNVKENLKQAGIEEFVTV